MQEVFKSTSDELPLQEYLFGFGLVEIGILADGNRGVGTLLLKTTYIPQLVVNLRDFTILNLEITHKKE